jgi:RHS repeat-associated protein
VHAVESGRRGEQGGGDQRLDRGHVADDEDGPAFPAGQHAVERGGDPLADLGEALATGGRHRWVGSVTVAARTGASSLAFVAGDTQGTDSVAIDSQTLTATHRYYDPYGNPRGTAPPSFPVGEKAFVGGANDTATGLTDLGVREYQPGSGSFISPDPQLNPYDPQDLNAYTYAADNPTSKSDPTARPTFPSRAATAAAVTCSQDAT